MNNLQHIVKDNTRFAMHMAVELCEQGDFDSVSEAFKWLNQETVGNYTHWHELFGTPERAARTIIKTCDETTECEACPIFHADINALNVNCSDYDALLGWMMGDA